MDVGGSDSDKKVESYNAELALGLNAMRKDEKFCDAALVTPNGTKFPCHRVVLSALSRFFEAMFDTEMMEGKSGEVLLGEDEDVCEAVLAYMYTGKTDINDSNVDALLNISSEWQMKSLNTACVTYLDKNLSTKNCLKVIELARLLGLKKTEENAKSLVVKEFALVSSSEEFKYISEISTIIDILKNKELNVRTPNTVCNAVFSWIVADMDNREQYIPKLLQTLTNISIGVDTIQETPSVVHGLSENEIFQKEIRRLYQQQIDKKAVCLFSKTDDSLAIVCGKEGQSDKEVLCFSFKRKRWYKLRHLPSDPGHNFAMCSFSTSMFLSGGSANKKQFLRFVGERNSWVSCMNLPTPRQYHSMVSVGLFIYIIGGCEHPSSVPFKEIEAFDVRAEIWLHKNHPAELVKPVRSCSCAVVDDTIFIFGGFDNHQQTCDIIQYYNTRGNYTGGYHWCKVPKELQIQIRVVSIEGGIYLLSKDGSIHEFKIREEKLVKHDKIDGGKFPRRGYCACDWDDKIFIVGGEVKYQPRKDMLQYKLKEKVIFSMQEELPFPCRDFIYTKYSVPNEILQYEKIEDDS